MADWIDGRGQARPVAGRAFGFVDFQVAFVGFRGVRIADGNGGACPAGACCSDLPDLVGNVAYGSDAADS